MIYFYPKDDTPGCTIEALEFTARLAEFEAADTAVVGISKDSVKSHERFCDKHGLGIPLLSDETGEVCERFGVWGEKSMYGRNYMGIDRSTFLVDAAGASSRAYGARCRCRGTSRRCWRRPRRSAERRRRAARIAPARRKGLPHGA